MNEINVFAEGSCAICKKRTATQLCDYVVDYNRNPIFLRDYKQFRFENDVPKDETCDLPLCKTCSYHRANADLCPYHRDIQRKAALPKHLQKYADRAKSREAQETIRINPRSEGT